MAARDEAMGGEHVGRSHDSVARAPGSRPGRVLGHLRAAGTTAALLGGATVTALLAPVTGPPAAASATGWAAPAPAYSLGDVLNLPVVAADGTVLRADVYFPTSRCSGSACPNRPAPVAGGFPVLLQQTPYGKQTVVQAGGSFASDVASLVDQGYVVVLADVRGTGESGGTWGLLDPVQATDGALLARWAADELPATGRNRGGITDAVKGLAVNGTVGLFGASYMGINEFLTVHALDADGGPNPVRAMFPVITGNDLYRDVVTQGGIPNVEFSAAYLALLDGLGTVSPLLDPFEEQSTASAHGGVQGSAFLEELAGFPLLAAGHAGQVPQFDVPTVLDVETGGVESVDQNEGFASGYWAQRNPVNALWQVVRDHIPTFLVGGWNDLFQRGELLNYTGLQNAWYDQTTGATEPITGPMHPGQPASPRYQLLMGPWTHLTAGNGSDITTVELEWFASWLPGPAHQSSTPVTQTSTPLHVFELGSGQWDGQHHGGAWLDTADWPVSNAAGPLATKLYFGPGAAAAPLSGSGGTLTTSPPRGTGGADTVVFTGLSSPCSLGTDQWGGGAVRVAATAGGPAFTWPCDANDSSLGAGPGALSYTSGRFGSPAVLAGPIDATVFATSTTPDTELVATVEEVSPSGQSVPLTTGALLGTMRAVDAGNSWGAADGAPLVPFHPYTRGSERPVVPGKVTEYDIEVFPTFALVPKGWALRLTLTTSDTPHMLPTLVDGPGLIGGVYRVQRTAGAASFLNVPLISPSSFPTRCSAAVCMPGGATRF